MIKTLVKIVFFLFFVCFMHAQDKDVQIWNNFKFVYKPISNLSLTIDNGVRFSDNISEFSRYFVSFDIKRKHSKLLSYSIGYRYLFDFNRIDNTTNVHRKNRWYLDAYLKQTILKKIKFSLRTRFQSQMSVTFLNYSEVKNKLRQKCRFLYNFKKPDLDAFLSIEAFFLLDNTVDKLRYQVGCRKSIAKRTNLSLIYTTQKDMVNSDWFFIFQSKLSHEF